MNTDHRIGPTKTGHGVPLCAEDGMDPGIAVINTFGSLPGALTISHNLT